MPRGHGGRRRCLRRLLYLRLCLWCRPGRHLRVRDLRRGRLGAGLLRLLLPGRHLLRSADLLGGRRREKRGSGRELLLRYLGLCPR